MYSIVLNVTRIRAYEFIRKTHWILLIRSAKEQPSRAFDHVAKIFFFRHIESLSIALPFRGNKDVSPDAGHIAHPKSVDIELAWQNFEKNVFNLPS